MAEKLFPVAIDGHPRRERVVIGRQPHRQPQTVERGALGPRIEKTRRTPAGMLGPRLKRNGANAKDGRMGLMIGLLRHDQGADGLPAHFADFRIQRGELFPLRPRRLGWWLRVRHQLVALAHKCIEAGLGLGRENVQRRLIGMFVKGHQPVEVLLRERIVFVVVALGASQRGEEASGRWS